MTVISIPASLQGNYSVSIGAAWPASRAKTDPDGFSGNGLYGFYIYTGTSIATLWRVFVYFDTSSIPAGAVISAAKLELYHTQVLNDFSAWSATLLSGMPTYPHNPFDMAPGADWDLDANYTNGGGQLASVDMTIGAYSSLNLSATGISWINKGVGAVTKFMVADLNNDVPNINPGVLGSDAGNRGWFQTEIEANPPLLTVTYTNGSAGPQSRTAEMLTQMGLL